MRKVVLGQTPKNFKQTVDVTLPDGEDTKMDVVYKYRKRTELAALLQEITGSIDGAAIKMDVQDIIGSTLVNIESDADTLMDVIEGWGLEHEFNRENVVRFCNEMPTATYQIIQQYFFGTKSVRLGN